MTEQEVRMWALDRAAALATQEAVAGRVPTPEDIERWATRAYNFALHGKFGGAPQPAPEPKTW